MTQPDLFGHTMTVPSASDPTVTYTIDTQKQTCTCPAFQRAGICKHLTQYGIITVQEPTRPTISQAMSAFIKAYRLRWPDEAVYWAAYIWMDPKARFRLVRRVLIAGGEDNLCLGIMARAARLRGHWAHLTFTDIAREVIRATHTPNWWSQPSGQSYVHAFRLAADSPQLKAMQGWSWPALEGLFWDGVKSDDCSTALLALEAGWHHTKQLPGFAERLHQYAYVQGAMAAAKTMAHVLAQQTTMKIEGNHVCQAVVRLFDPDLGDQTVPAVSRDEARAHVETVKHELLHEPRRLRACFQDGVHTSGRDARFAGTPKAMAGMCLAYNHFGRLHPDDAWPARFWKGHP